MGLYHVRYHARYHVRSQFLVPVLGHHERKATHQERTELGKACFLKPHQDTTEQYQHDAKDGGLPVSENPIYHF